MIPAGDLPLTTRLGEGATHDPEMNISSRQSTSSQELNHESTIHRGIEMEKEHDSVGTPTSDSTIVPVQTHDPTYEISFDGLDDPLNPRGFSNARKWSIVLICSSTSLAVTCTSSLFVMTYPQIELEFGISNIVATLGVSLFVAGLGISPMLLGPLSEVRSCVVYP